MVTKCMMGQELEIHCGTKTNAIARIKYKTIDFFVITGL